MGSCYVCTVVSICLCPPLSSWNTTGRILSGDQVSVMVLPGENSKLEEMMSTLCPLSGESVYT